MNKNPCSYSPELLHDIIYGSAADQTDHLPMFCSRTYLEGFGFVAKFKNLQLAQFCLEKCYSSIFSANLVGIM